MRSPAAPLAPQTASGASSSSGAASAASSRPPKTLAPVPDTPSALFSELLLKVLLQRNESKSKHLYVHGGLPRRQRPHETPSTAGFKSPEAREIQPREAAVASGESTILLHVPPWLGGGRTTQTGVCGGDAAPPAAGSGGGAATAPAAFIRLPFPRIPGPEIAALGRLEEVPRHP